MFFPYALLLIGLFFLLNNLGFLTAELWGIFWPSLIILWALSMIMKRKDGGSCCGWPREEEKKKKK